MTLQLYHSFDWANVTFSTAFREFDTNNREDEDGTNRSNLYFDTANIESNSSSYTELKFNGVNGAVDWVAGVSWYTESADQTSDTHLNTDSINTLYSNLGGFPLYSILQATLDGYQIPFNVIGNPWQEAMVNTGDFTALAFFGDAIWHVTDKLNLTFGLRYTNDHKEFSWYNGPHAADELNQTLAALESIGFLPVYYAGLDAMGEQLGLPPGYLPSLYTKDIVWDYSAYGIEGQTVKAKNDWSNWSPRFVIDYAISDDMMIWGSYTQGYKAGGYNSVEINSKFDNEDVDNFEIGIKADFPDQRLGINSSLFSYVYNNKQSIFLDPNTSSGVPQYLTSTSDIEAWGWDIQLYWNPVDNLTVQSQQPVHRPELQGFRELGGHRSVRAGHRSAEVVDLGRRQLHLGSPRQFEPGVLADVRLPRRRDLQCGLAGPGHLPDHGQFRPGHVHQPDRRTPAMDLGGGPLGTRCLWQEHLRQPVCAGDKQHNGQRTGHAVRQHFRPRAVRHRGQVQFLS